MPLEYAAKGVSVKRRRAKPAREREREREKNHDANSTTDNNDRIDSEEP